MDWNLCRIFKSIGKKEYETETRGIAGRDGGLGAARNRFARQTSHSAVDPAYQQSFEKWKGELVEDLKQEWLPLAGLFWLKPGENSFGTDAENAIVFPKGPAHAGSFTLQGQTCDGQVGSRHLTLSLQANRPPRPNFSRIRQTIPR